MTDTDQPSLLFRRASLIGQGACDVRVVGAKIVAVAKQLGNRPGERVIEADGKLLIPGLHDHHLHLFATAAARDSLFCGPPDVTDESALATRLQRHCRQVRGVVRGVGFHESICAELDRDWLDRVCPEHPVKIQHRSGMLWVLNSRALKMLNQARDKPLPEGVERDEAGRMTGRFFNLDQWLSEHLTVNWPSLRQLSRELARCGISGVTDTGVNNGVEAWRALNTATECGELLQRVLVMGSEALNGIEASDPDRMAVGPLKIYLREAELPDFDQLVQRIQSAHRVGRNIAAHCVTRAELHYLIEAVAMAGSFAGDRIEHASVCDDEALARIEVLGMTVVTQPHFIAERGDQYLRDVDGEDIPLLYRGAGFLDGGVTLAAGSDAPYGSIDPWWAMKTAVLRTTSAGISMRSDECLTPEQALALYGEIDKRPAGKLREIAMGQKADLCLLDLPWEMVRSDLSAEHVVMTLCNGDVVFER